MDEDALIELEIQQELEGINLDADDQDFDEGVDDNNNDEDNIGAGIGGASYNESSVEAEMVPQELQDYIKRIQKQRLDFEQEIQDIDSVLTSNPLTDYQDSESKLVVYEDWKELEEAAAQEGLTVEDYKLKLLHEIENDPFELEELDFGDDDFDKNLKALLESNNLQAVLPSVDDKPLEAEPRPVPKELTAVEEEGEIALALMRESDEEDAEGNSGGTELSAVGYKDSEGGTVGPRSTTSQEKEANVADGASEPADGVFGDVEGGAFGSDLGTAQEKDAVLAGSGTELAIAGNEDAGGDADGAISSTSEDKDAHAGDGTETASAEEKDSEVSSAGVIAIRRMNPLLEFEQFLREQMQLAEERYQQRELQLRQELDAKRAVEEKLMLTMEKERLEAMRMLEKEEQELAHRKQERQEALDREIEERQKHLEIELKQYEETISALTEQLENDRDYLEKTRRAEEERQAQQNQSAATTIQQCYRGYRVRKLHEAEKATLAQRREQRKLDKEQQRIEEIEAQIQERKEAERRQKEMERQKQEEEERRQKEEEERKLEEERKAKEEKERKRKEEEDRKRKEKEEKRKLEEEKKQKEEEAKRLKEEEKKKRKEEAERKRKEEEERKQREKEERKRQQEEEKKRKEEEERKRKKEEERKKQEEEDRRRQEEEEKKRIEEEKKKKEEEEKQKKIEEEKRKKAEEEERLKREEEQSRTVTDDKNQTQDESERKKENRTENCHLEESQAIKSVTDEKQHDETIQTSEHTNPNVLPEHLESRRLTWMKSCLPWSKISNEPWKLKSATGGKAPRRPSSAKKLSPLPNDVILAAAQVASLRQVTTVELHDLPGHSLSTLSQCVHLKHLKMQRCGLVSLEHLTQSKHLQCIDVQENLIEYVDIKELNELHVVNLSHNKLTTIHGFTGCGNIRWLDVSHNRLTKLGGLSPLRRLHTLLAGNNQLVSTSGLEQCPSIQRLDLSSNYLTSVEGLDRLGLLLRLDISSNNLSQIPRLENQVLLQELILRENSIGPSIDLSVAWLPLLTSLDLSQNIIEDVKGSGSGMFVLKHLDLAVNQILELPGFLPAVSDCPRLEDLSVLGNPVLGEDGLRNNVKNAVPSLRHLNGETVRTLAEVNASSIRSTSFEAMCLTQVQLHKDIQQTFEKECRAWDTHPHSDTSHSCEDSFRFCDKSFRMAVEHRYTHEYGELSSANIPAAPSTPRSTQPSSARSPKLSAHDKRSSHDSLVSNQREIPDTVERELNRNCNSPKKDRSLNVQPGQPLVNAASSHNEASAPVLSEKEKFELALRGELPKADAVHSKDSSHPESVSVSVHRWSSHGATAGLGEPGFGGDVSTGAFHRRNSEDANVAERIHNSQAYATTPQLSAKEKFERALAGPSLDPTHETEGSMVINPAKRMPRGQDDPDWPSRVTADVVGDLLTSEGMGHTSGDRTLAADKSALPSKVLDNSSLDDLEEMMEGLQFDIDGFLDLEQFDFDEDFLEKGWRPDDTPQLPQRIPSSASAKPPLPPVPSLHLGSTHSPAPPPGKPVQAWRTNLESPLSDIQMKLQPRPPSSVTSGEDSQAAPTGRSRREERIAEEWGFKDSRTAELMMQRAKKMKYNAERRKKLSKLDPHQRLKLFRKIEEVTRINAVRPPPARVLPRKEYFQAREEEAQQKEMEKQMEMRTKAGRTFEWIHTQVGDYDLSSSRINNMKPVPRYHGDENELKKTTSDSQLSGQQNLFHTVKEVDAVHQEVQVQFMARQGPLVYWDRLDESWETFQSFQDNSRRVDIKLNETREAKASMAPL
nr:hypothetical protein BaRGS_012741 [Batillaria attramentaria]